MREPKEKSTKLDYILYYGVIVIALIVALVSEKCEAYEIPTPPSFTSLQDKMLLTIDDEITVGDLKLAMWYQELAIFEAEVIDALEDKVGRQKTTILTLSSISIVSIAGLIVCILIN